MKKIKISVAIPSEGMGHALRSSVVIQHLLDSGHKVNIITSGRCVKFLNDKFPQLDIIEINGLSLSYKNNKVDKVNTLINNLKTTKHLIKNTKKISKAFKEFKPDLVISDFDSAASTYAKLNDVPCISIDNIQVINRCKIDKILRTTNYQLAKNIVKFKTPGCKKYFITTFFNTEVKKKKTELYNPIIRKEIIEAEISEQNHIVVYQTSESNNSLFDKLKLTNEIYFVYGAKRNITEKIKDGNLIYKPFSEESFIKDVASSKAVITGGGFTVISEALYLKKPIYSLPVKNQFEQELNAYYLDKMGYGSYCKDIKLFDINKFLTDVPFYKDNLNNYKHDNNQRIFKDLDKFIKGL